LVMNLMRKKLFSSNPHPGDLRNHHRAEANRRFSMKTKNCFLMNPWINRQSMKERRA